MKKLNFLLGKGERLAEEVRVVMGGASKAAPYTFEQAKQRLQPMLNKVVDEIRSLPQEACPEDYAIATLTLNPEYIAKSYHPKELLRAAGLEAVGSRSRRVKPDSRSKNRIPEETVTTELFLLGKRQSFVNWAEQFPSWTEEFPGANQLIEIEQISFPSSSSKVKGISPEEKEIVYEVILHLNEVDSERRILGQFQQYLKRFKLNPDFKHRFYAGGLCFLELEASATLANEIAQFSLVRVVRAMPELRLLRPTVRTSLFADSAIELPDFEPIDKNIKVAIFDGGIPLDHPICRWATPYEEGGLNPADDELYEHGVAVTSAFLFGHIDPKKQLPQPYSYVDHYRVLDNAPGQNLFELYQVLDRVKNVLDSKNYDFINLSLGPRLPIDDDEIHAWTAVLDEYLSDGQTLCTVAVGNDGEGDPMINANRVQVPSDCVNALSIGACDIPDDNWQRALYSSIGPGRSPGLVKPDLVDFGGSIQRPFLTLDSLDGNKLRPTGGTSFSAPSVLRMGAGVRAHFGQSLNALSIRTLLVHSAETADIPKFEIGWGRIARSLEDIVICPDHEIRVVFQGRINASKFVRVPIPLPTGVLKGMISIRATLCYATPCDPHHPGNYTRSGLEVTFRPNKDLKKKPEDGKKEPLHAASKSFFGKGQKAFQTEEELRRDAWKWENCVHSEVRFRGSSLNGPIFDIHYNARFEGHTDNKNQEMEYALVITVTAPRIEDLYDQVVRKYATQLEQLQPIVEVPIRVSQ
ncbi:MAG: S8 family peptidase [Saprospiraceae bacterium]|nr:S8 family peptidase [Candidatus Opimibacter iunctus]